MSRFYYAGSNAILDETVRDANGVLINADSITVTAVDSAGAPITVAAPSAISPGNYQAKSGLLTTGGDGTATWTVTVSGFTTVDMYTFTVLTSPPVVSVADFAAYIGNASIDSSRATFLLLTAQALCESIVSPLPAGAAAVVLDVAARGFTNPNNAQQQTDGPFSVSYGAIAGGLWLTNNNKATLRNLAGQVGAFTIDTMPATAGQGLSWWNYGNTADASWDTFPS